MKKWLLLLLAVSSVYAQEGTPVKGLFGAGPPNANIAHVIGTQYIDTTTSLLYVCTAVTLTATVSSCTWTGAGGAAANSPSPANQALGPQYNIRNYGALGNTQQIATVGIQTINAGTDGCPSAAPGGKCVDIPASLNSPFKQSDIGLTLYGNEGASGLNRLGPGTIAGVFTGTGAHAGDQMVTYSGSFSGCGGGCIIVWGTDDTTAIRAAATASQGACSNGDGTNYFNPTCGQLTIPCGGYMTQGGGGAFPGISSGVLGTAYVGTAMDCTTFFLRPDYNAGTVGNTLGIFLALPSSGSAFTKIADFSINCSGFKFSFANNSFLSTNGPADVKSVRITNCGNTSTSNAQALMKHTGRTSNLTVADPTIGNASPLCGFNGGDSDVYFLFCSNGNATNCSNLLITNVVGGTSSNRLAFHGGFIDEGSASAGNANTCVQASKDVSFIGTTLTSGALNTAYSISVDATSEVRCSSCTLAPFGANGGGGVTVASGGVFRTTLSKFIANGAGAADWNCATVTSCVDDGANNYSFTNGATYLAAGSSVPYSSLTHTYPEPTFAALPTSGVAATFSTFTPTQPLSISRVTIVSSNSASCATPAVFTITQSGSSTFTLTMTGSGQTSDSGAITTNNTFIAATAINIGFTSTAYTCATAPINMNIAIEWQSFGGL